MAEKDSLRLIIAGAGIAGLAAAIALKRVSEIPHLDIQLYEQAPELLEIGASIALSPNGMRTLEKLGVHEALTDEVGYRGPSGIPQIFRHWKTDQVVSFDTHTDVPDPRHHTTRFHRGHLHSALLEHLAKTGSLLNFEDGSSAHGDILIGADGIRSKVRESFIPEYKLRFSGKVFMRSTFDASLIEGKIPNLPADSMHWWGPKDNFFASRLGKGQYTTVGAYDDPRTAEELERSVTWDQRGSVDFLRARYKDWNPTIRALTQLTPYTNIYTNFAGDALPTWVFGSRVTLIGDAAHAHGGAFAAGGSLALDDALALGLALKHVFNSSLTRALPSVDGVGKALELYSETRQPHTARLLRIIHNQINQKPRGNLTAEEEDAALLARMKNRPDTVWLSEHDVEAAFAATVEQLEAGNVEKSQSLESTEPERKTRQDIELQGSKI